MEGQCELEWNDLGQLAIDYYHVTTPCPPFAQSYRLEKKKQTNKLKTRGDHVTSCVTMVVIWEVVKGQLLR